MIVKNVWPLIFKGNVQRFPRLDAQERAVAWNLAYELTLYKDSIKATSFDNEELMRWKG